MKLGQLIGVLLVASALYILWEIRQILLLVFAAVVLANSLNLLAHQFRRWGLSRSLAVGLSIVCLILALIGFVFLIVPPFLTQFKQLAELVPQGVTQLNDQVNRWINLVPPQFRSSIPDVEELARQAQPLANRLLGGSVAIFSNSLGGLLNVLFIVVLGIMMLVNPAAYRKGFIRLFPSFYRRRVESILDECEESLGGWIVGAMISMAVVAIFSTIGLMIIGVPAALAQGVLAGLLNFIPNLGPAFSVVPPMLIALLDPHAPIFKSLLVLGLYFLIQQLESNLLTPVVMAHQVSLLPAVTLFGQLFFATLFGFLGLLLAIPLVVVGQIWLKRVLMEDILDRWDTVGAMPSGPIPPPALAPMPTDTLTTAEQMLQRLQQLTDPPASDHSQEDP